MEFERVRTVHHPMYSKALELYRTSFPFHERREARSQIEILGDDGYHFCLVYDGDVFVGLVLYWELGSAIYIEHLCVSSALRNFGYGKRILSALSGRYDMLILEIDPPIDDISIRRKAFYERCGFVANSYRHVHPPYHENMVGHELVVMTYPCEISAARYEEFFDYLSNRVMYKAF